MKSIIRIIFMLMLALPAVGNAQIATFERFADRPGLSYTFISHTMLQMASKYGKATGLNTPVAPIIDKLTGLQEISTIDKENGSKLIKDVKEIAKTDKYELLVSIDRPAEQRYVYFKPKDSKHRVASVIIIKSSGKDTIVIGITGHFDTNDLTGIIR